MAVDFDVVFVGGGLSAGLSVLALRAAQPGLRLGLVERDGHIGGNHTWCFHAADCPADARTFVDPLVAARWQGYSVRFPRRVRRIGSSYACIPSSRLHEALTAAAGASAGQLTLALGASARDLSPRHVALDDGRLWQARLLIDARGPSALSDAPAGYQKFVGLECLVEPGYDLGEPLLIDASVPQNDGFRFVYTLPLASDRVLLEDTYFSENAALDDVEIERGLHAYAETLGVRVQKVIRRERGVLPLPFFPSAPEVDARPLRAGYGGGYFHPVTGYSFPMAVRFALALARSDIADIGRSELAAYARQLGPQRDFLHFLTRAMFRWFPPAQRFRVLEHFYRLPEPLIARFYAAELSRFDRVRMFIGAPPRGLSLRRSFGALREVQA